MESLLLSPTSANQDLILKLVSASPRNGISKQLSRNYLVSTTEVIGLIGP